MEACVGSGPLPVSKYPLGAVAHGYGPAPLDELSLWNGLCKFQHDQSTITASEAQFMLDALEYWFPSISQYSDIADDDVVMRELELHKTKTAGYPWSIRHAPLKGQAVATIGLPAIEEYYQQFSSIIGSTLKDELRPVGKDARFFRPQDVSSYVEAIRLFYHQNSYLMRQLLVTPLFNRYVIPGQTLPSLFRILDEFSTRCYAADGSQWDANYPLVLACIVAAFRSGPSTQARVERYYSMMYNGYTNVGGNIFGLVGQPSGHYNTSVDNSMANMCLMALHACRLGWSLDDFVQRVCFYCCGDDLIWADREGSFNPESLSATYASVGVYLEFESLLPKRSIELTFVGQRLMPRVINGINCWLTALRRDRTLATSTLRKRRATDLDELAKLVSLVQLCFGDEELFDIVHGVMQRFVTDCLSRHTLSMSDPEVLGLLRSVTYRRLCDAHLSWEAATFPRPRWCA